MIPFLIAFAAAQIGPPAPTTDKPPVSEQQALSNCISMARTDPEKAARLGGEWRDLNGGISAAHCLGNALSALERWSEAAAAFEGGAAGVPPTPRTAELWSLSGNAWLAASDATRARTAFDAALAVTTIPDQLRADALLDRARAGVMLGDSAGAREDIDKAVALTPSNAFGWYLSAALAERQQQLGKAQADIAKAIELAPSDAAMLLLAGNIAGKLGDVETARANYARAAKADPQSEAGRSAQAALSEGAPAGEAP